jgi:hypothetical protein
MTRRRKKKSGRRGCRQGEEMGEEKKKKKEEEEIRKKSNVLGCRIILCNFFFFLCEVSNCDWGAKTSLYAKTEFKLFPSNLRFPL